MAPARNFYLLDLQVYWGAAEMNKMVVEDHKMVTVQFQERTYLNEEFLNEWSLAEPEKSIDVSKLFAPEQID